MLGVERFTPRIEPLLKTVLNAHAVMYAMVVPAGLGECNGIEGWMAEFERSSKTGESSASNDPKRELPSRVQPSPAR